MRTREVFGPLLLAPAGCLQVALSLLTRKERNGRGFLALPASLLLGKLTVPLSEAEHSLEYPYLRPRCRA